MTPWTVNEAQFWEERYQNQEVGWDLGIAAPALRRFVQDQTELPRGAILVLGCGQGHDAIFLAQQGFRVTAVDFAPTAIARLQEAAQAAHLPITCWQRDLFTLSPEDGGRFDYVWEHTCFCAIDPDRRAEYRQVVHRMLQPGGELWAIFFTHSRPGGPPFGSDPKAIGDLFASHFQILTLNKSELTVAGREGEEYWGRFQRKNPTASPPCQGIWENPPHSEAQIKIT